MTVQENICIVYVFLTIRIVIYGILKNLRIENTAIAVRCTTDAISRPRNIGQRENFWGDDSGLSSCVSMFVLYLLYFFVTPAIGIKISINHFISFTFIKCYLTFLNSSKYFNDETFIMKYLFVLISCLHTCNNIPFSFF